MLTGEVAPFNDAAKAAAVIPVPQDKCFVLNTAFVGPNENGVVPLKLDKIHVRSPWLKVLLISDLSTLFKYRVIFDVLNKSYEMG